MNPRTPLDLTSSWPVHWKDRERVPGIRTRQLHHHSYAILASCLAQAVHDHFDVDNLQNPESWGLQQKHALHLASNQVGTRLDNQLNWKDLVDQTYFHTWWPLDSGWLESDRSCLSSSPSPSACWGTRMIVGSKRLTFQNFPSLMWRIWGILLNPKKTFWWVDLFLIEHSDKNL